VATAYFVDSSALVKRYVLETGTAWVRGITRRRSSTDIFIALITAVEVTLPDRHGRIRTDLGSGKAERDRYETVKSDRACGILIEEGCRLWLSDNSISERAGVG